MAYVPPSKNRPGLKMLAKQARERAEQQARDEQALAENKRRAQAVFAAQKIKG